MRIFLRAQIVSRMNVPAIAVSGKQGQNEGMGSHFKGEKEGKIPEELDVAWTTLLTILGIMVGSLES